ncbi:hypothetical protein, conserved in T. vivax [Trypanosoma vivax Y486]|uniref:Uncharacterized protein n=1 Tax=Trypanosoma vivax (strain Y486) TaxID=1055687 RepID=F9WVX9_TRYVY|nr:hypothetical protein, conserved in T. vivax [Trypanosoma vivax Y486]|eukprot:CCD21743.1 hypothetical protein, conserved in T. vivax [Trypanosoma vivax Y486]
MKHKKQMRHNNDTQKQRQCGEQKHGASAQSERQEKNNAEESNTKQKKRRRARKNRQHDATKRNALSNERWDFVSDTNIGKNRKLPATKKARKRRREKEEEKEEGQEKAGPGKDKKGEVQGNTKERQEVKNGQVRKR